MIPLFASDNVSGVCPEVLAALAAANSGNAMPYGGDPWSERLTRRLAELFEHEVAVFPVATGTAANALGLSAVTPAWGAIYCHPEAHVNVDECGAPELFTGGAKLRPVDGPDGKIAADALQALLADAGKGAPHHVVPAAVSLAQATEAGTVYSPAEVSALSALAHRHGLAVQMDGARFANALATLGCSPAAITWQAGVDVLAFGATKNGALAAEAVVLFDPAKAADLPYRRKRGGHLFSKHRFLATQLIGYLENEVWLRNARHANAMAQRLAAGLSALPGVRLVHPVQANELFVELPAAMVERLAARGMSFYPWGKPAAGTHRLVTAWDTDPAQVDRVLAAAREASMVNSR